ncbi:MAG TPA: HNH endonuclease [Devosiaceae bacterium]
MANLKKPELLARFEEAVRLSGWNMLYLNQGSHPARYQVFKNGNSVTVRIYIWNITHGGKGRAPGEYRIQITGFDHFDLELNGRTLIVGWWDDAGVFAGWDARRHTGPLGGSPSMQVSEDTLRKAIISGFSPYMNQKGETAIAFRPDFAGTYIEFLEPLHDSGAIPAEAELLVKLGEDPDKVSEQDIEDEIGEETRKYAVLQTKKALRASDFARRVLSAYDHACAMCGTQLRLIDGAHILPVEQTGSTDETRNGVALCALHHRAYDRSLVTFDPVLKICINDDMVRRLKAEDRAGGLKEFRAGLKPYLFATADKKDRPATKFVNKANKLRGWNI